MPQPQNAVQLDKWLKLLHKKYIAAANFIFRKKDYKTEYLQQGAVKQLREELVGYFTEAVQTGLAHQDNHISDAMRKKMDEDLFIFSACKTESELREVGALLRNADGTLKSHAAFIKEVQSLYSGHISAYLQAEHSFATASSQMAAKWHNYVADGDAFHLQYRTAQDDRVRDSHAKLANVTLPIDDDFWNHFFPPNGWRCRCTVVQVKKNKYPLSDSAQAIADGNSATSTEKLKIFRFNPGKQGTVFPPHHPYQKEKERIAAIVKDKEAGLTIAYESANGATVKAHDNADAYDFPNNIKQAKKLADNGDNVIIREHINGAKNPELEIEGRMADFKGTDKTTTSGVNAIRNAFKTSKNQQIDFIVFVMPDKFYEREAIANKLFGEFKSDKINDVWMLFDNNKVAKLKRSMSKQEIYDLLP